MQRPVLRRSRDDWARRVASLMRGFCDEVTRCIGLAGQAGDDSVHGLRGRRGWRLRARGLELEQDLVVLDHPELVSRALLDCLVTGLEIAHVGVQRVVSDLELRVGVTLQRDLPVVLADLQPAAFPKPHRVLERDNQRDEDVGENSHDSGSLAEVEERRTAGIARGVAQILLDPQELVVLGDALGARQGSGLDLPALVATAMSAMIESSVSPERCDTTAV